MELSFKTIEPEGLDDVLELFKKAAEKIHEKKVDHWQYWHNPPASKVEWVKDGIASGEFKFIIANDHLNVGMIRLMDEDLLYWGPQEEKSKYVHSFVIRGDFNGLGFGKKVLQLVGELGAEAGCKYIRLDADFKNPRLCQYYLDLGFKKVRVKKLALSDYQLFEKCIASSEPLA